MKVNIKKLNPNAIIPSYAKQGDAGLDLTSIGLYQPQKNEDGTGIVSYSTGLAIEIPEGYVGLLFPRSSVADTSLTLANCVGVIDSGYRGEIIVRFRVNATFPQLYQPGDRVAQLIIMPFPSIEFEEVSELSATERGENGFGSTNIKEENDGIKTEIGERDSEIVSTESENDSSIQTVSDDTSDISE